MLSKFHQKLTQDGDILFMPTCTSKLQRIHGVFISENDLTSIPDFAKRQKESLYNKTILDIQPDEKAKSQ